MAEKFAKSNTLEKKHSHRDEASKQRTQNLEAPTGNDGPLVTTALTESDTHGNTDVSLSQLDILKTTDCETATNEDGCKECKDDVDKCKGAANCCIQDDKKCVFRSGLGKDLNTGVCKTTGAKTDKLATMDT